MSLSLLNLFCAADPKLFVTSAGTGWAIASPQFLQGESPPTGFTLLCNNPSGGTAVPWTKVSPAQYSLRLGLFQTSSALQLAFQDTWVDDAANAQKIASFDFTDANVTTALAGGSSVDCTLEAEVKDVNGKTSKIQLAVTLKKQFITPAAVSVAAGEVAATQAWVKATFFPKDGTAAQNPVNQFVIFSQPGNIPILCYFDDAGKLHSDPQG